jgi:hypothetical protein
VKLLNRLYGFVKRNIDMSTTLVTGLWNIKRDSLTEGWSRSFEHYLEKFDQLLKVENNMIIFGDPELESFIFERRTRENTQFIPRSQEWFKNDIFEKIQKIRTNPDWYNQSGWLPESTQAKLDMYNPLVMSKMFLLNDARIMDQFDSTHLFWIDAGITNTVHWGYFTHDKIQNKFESLFPKFGFVAFPYKAETEIHGFTYPKINQYAGADVKLVCRGGLFGGNKNYISDVNGIYYNILTSTLSDGYMGTEESIFSIMLYRHSDIFDYYEIEDNGLIGKFCEDLKNDQHVLKNVNATSNFNKLSIDNTALYVITFNSPKQFETLIKSMELYDNNFLTKPKKFLLDNSSDLSTTEEYSVLCEQYGFEHIKKDNLGICGGRQWIAEHAKENDFDFYWFFEDDMFFYNGKDTVCRNGFNRYVSGIYEKSLEIIKNYSLDFIKLNYSEFYGDNGVQWSWYNVPQQKRVEYWPEKPNLPVHGLDPNAPRTKFNQVFSHKQIPFAIGEVYYCNWPQVVSKYGNEKMFLTTKWDRPFEQTWMSYIFQETKVGNIKPALMLITPTEHDRFEFYEASLRKES